MPEKIIDKFNLKICPICGGVNFDFLISSEDKYSDNKKKYHVLSCKECDYSFTYLPSDVQSSEFYPQDYRQLKKGLSNFQKNLYLIYYRIFFPHKWFKKGCRILDIGCGNGLLSLFLKKRGNNVTCIEQNERSANFAAKNIGLNVHKGELEDANLPDNYFDMVILRHSLEHIKNTGETLKEILRILKENGSIFVEVPNIRSKEFSLFKSNFYHLDLPRHLHHFSPESLKRIFEKYNLEVKQLKFDNFMPQSFSMSLIYCIEKLINKRFPCIIKELICILIYPLSVALNYFASLDSSGSIMRMIVVKRDT